jgi:predicted nuclease with TOPRIM domain
MSAQDSIGLAAGIISLLAVTLQVIAGVSKMLDDTIAAHRTAGEELERLRHSLEELQKRIESNRGKLASLANNTKNRTFKKLLKRYAVSLI